MAYLLANRQLMGCQVSTPPIPIPRREVVAVVGGWTGWGNNLPFCKNPTVHRLRIKLRLGCWATVWIYMYPCYTNILLYITYA